MGAVLKILGFVLAAVGLVVWLGGTGFISSEILRDTAASGEMPRTIGGFVAVAGLVIALIGSVLVLRVTHNVIPFVICFACGLLAFFGGLKVNPAVLAEEPMALAIAAAVLAIPTAALLVTRKMIPFLSSVAVLGLLGAGAMYFTGMPMGAAPSEEAAVATTPEGDVAPPADMAPPATEAPAPPPPPAAATAPPPAAAPAPQPEMAQAPPAPVTTDDILPGAGAPAREEMAEAAPPAAAPARPRSRGLGGILGGTLARPAAPAPPPPPAAAAPMPPAAGPGGEPRSADLAAPSGGGASAPPATASAPPPASAPVETASAPKPPTADEFGYQDANLKFNKAENMELGREYQVGATITLPNSVATPATLGDVGPTVTRETKITRKVRVELVGGGSFDVTPANPVTTFLITANTPGVWNWTVKPRKEGEGRMQLQVFGVLERDDGVAEGEVLIKTYEETIPVTVTPMGRVRLISQNVVENWEPVAGALGVIGGIWAFIVNLFAGLRRKREVKA